MKKKYQHLLWSLLFLAINAVMILAFIYLDFAQGLIISPFSVFLMFKEFFSYMATP